MISTDSLFFKFSTFVIQSLQYFRNKIISQIDYIVERAKPNMSPYHEHRFMIHALPLLEMLFAET